MKTPAAPRPRGAPESAPLHALEASAPARGGRPAPARTRARAGASVTGSRFAFVLWESAPAAPVKTLWESPPPRLRHLCLPAVTGPVPARRKRFACNPAAPLCPCPVGPFRPSPRAPSRGSDVPCYVGCNALVTAPVTRVPGRAGAPHVLQRGRCRWHHITELRVARARAAASRLERRGACVHLSNTGCVHALVAADGPARQAQLATRWLRAATSSCSLASHRNPGFTLQTQLPPPANGSNSYITNGGVTPGSRTRARAAPPRKTRPLSPLHW